MRVVDRPHWWHGRFQFHSRPDMNTFLKWVREEFDFHDDAIWHSKKQCVVEIESELIDCLHAMTDYVISHFIPKAIRIGIKFYEEVDD